MPIEPILCWTWYQSADQRQPGGHFGVRWFASGHEGETAADLCPQIIRVFVAQPVGEKCRLLIEEFAVDHAERLGGLNGGKANRRGVVGLGEIEAVENRHQQRTLHVNIDAAAGLVLR